MERRVWIEPEATEELAEARDWYEEQVDGLGYDLVEAVHDAIDRLRATPDGSTPLPQVDESLPLRHVFVKRFPYTIVFLDLGTEARVIAIAHQKRRPGYWRRR